MKRRLPAFAGAALLCGLVSACDEPPAPGIRVAAGSWAPFDLLFVAENHGLMRAEDVHLVEAPWALDREKALSTQSLDAVGVSLLNATQWISRGNDLTVVLVTDDAAGADVIIGKPGIDSMADLKGRTVAVDLNTVSGYFLTRVLAKNGMTLKDIKLVDLADRITIPQAFKTADAVATYADDMFETLRDGGHIVADSRDMKDEALDVLLVRTAFLQSHPDRVADMVEGWLRARAAYVGSDEAGRRAFANSANHPGNFLDNMKSLTLKTPEQNARLLADGGEGLRASATRVRDFLVDVGAIPAGSPIPKVSDGPFREAMKRIAENQDGK